MERTPNPAFCQGVQKLHDNIACKVDAAVAFVAGNPDIGELKKGDLAQLRIYKLCIHGQPYLLGYARDDEVRLVYLEAVGSYENFYRDLKR